MMRQGKMWAYIFFICSVFLPRLQGLPCQALDGTWYNQLGSEMKILSHKDGVLVGEYRTAVERYPGAAGDSYSHLRGVTDPSSPLFGFSVIFKSGNSTTSWHGQCTHCGGEEVLATTWILQATVQTCLDRWKSTMIGQDFFTRHEQKPGPRGNDGIDVPARPSDWMGTDLRRARLDSSRREPSVVHPCRPEGTWFDQDGSVLTIDSSLNGNYTSAVDQLTSPVRGFSVGRNFSSVFAFQTVQPGIDSVIVWTVQCQRCEDDNNVTLEASWLRTSKVNSCVQKEYGAKIGKIQYRRQPPRGVTPADEVDKGSWVTRAARVVRWFFSG